jgi:hypothetical protein
VVVLVVLLVVLVAGGIAAGGAVVAFGSRCDLSALRPARIGQNTFVYAADGSLLGVIPAERNRQVVPLGRMSPWLTRQPWPSRTSGSTSTAGSTPRASLARSGAT